MKSSALVASVAMLTLMALFSAPSRAQAEVQPDQFDNPNASGFPQAASPAAANNRAAKDSLPAQAMRSDVSGTSSGSNRAAAAARFLRTNYLGAAVLLLTLILQIVVASLSARAQQMFHQRQEIVSARVSRRGF